jgi:hypothetical protein
MTARYGVVGFIKGDLLKKLKENAMGLVHKRA